MAEIEVHDDAVALDVKRCYLPITIKSICPICATPAEKDLSSDYLSYPCVNAPERVGFVCIDEEGEENGHEWSVNIQIELRASVVSEEYGAREW